MMHQHYCGTKEPNANHFETRAFIACHENLRHKLSIFIWLLHLIQTRMVLPIRIHPCIIPSTVNLWGVIGQSWSFWQRKQAFKLLLRRLPSPYFEKNWAKSSISQTLTNASSLASYRLPLSLPSTHPRAPIPHDRPLSGSTAEESAPRREKPATPPRLLQESSTYKGFLDQAMFGCSRSVNTSQGQHRKGTS